MCIYTRIYKVYIYIYILILLALSLSLSLFLSVLSEQGSTIHQESDPAIEAAPGNTRVVKAVYDQQRACMQSFCLIHVYQAMAGPTGATISLSACMLSDGNA